MAADQPDLRPPLWYKDAVIYEVPVRAFADSNDDGIGDFPGLTSRLDYLSQLGVNAIWLLPFYPSPLRDDGYDIAEYRDVHSSYGTLDDFKEFLDAAHSRNMRVITELVINHTSDQHAWFQRARRAEPGSPERDFYVWSDTPDRFSDVRIIFQDTETSNWTWDPVAGAYYWHRFFSHQPDLNFDSPQVRQEVTDALRFWLDLGVDGLRLDAVPYLFEREGTNGENLPETHQELKRLRAFVDEHYDNRMLLAEANQWPEDSVAYFGESDECHMAFHFPVMPRLYLALQNESRVPIVDILEQTPPIPDEAQWAIFLRNHDELTLEMVTEEERDSMWRSYAPDRRARLNLGIRRRLAPLLENDRRRIELLFSLLLSLPGTPVLYYGDEIGMGDNIFLADRDGVRTPMQWSNDRNAGFSRAHAQSLFLPVVIDPQFHFETVNVEAQHANPNSLLWWVRDMIRRRHRHRVFGRGSVQFLTPDNEQVLAYLREGEGETILVVANLSRHSQFVELDLSRFAGRSPVEVLGQSEFPVIGHLPYLLSVGPYGFYWFSIGGPESTPLEDGRVLGVSGPLEGLFAADGPLPGVLGDYVSTQPWYQGWGKRRMQTVVSDLIPVTPGETDPAMWLAFVTEEYATGPADTYIVPVAVSLGPDLPLIEDDAVLARINSDGVDGVVYDALVDSRFRTRLRQAVVDDRSLLGRAGTLVCTAGSWIDDAGAHAEDASTVATTPRGETLVDYASGMTIKLFRRIEAGVNPDLELRRFLTERTGFDDLVDAYGALEYHSGDTHTVGVVEQSVSASRTAWDVCLDYADRWLGAVRSKDDVGDTAWGNWASTQSVTQRLPAPKALAPSLDLANRLATTTADMHLALASLSEDPDLRPEPFSLLYQQSLYQSLRSGARRELRAIRRLVGDGDSAVEEAVRDVIANEGALLSLLDPVRRQPISGSRIRVHGDYRLDEIRIVGDRVVIEDFSGDQARPISERRLRASPLRDVAQLLRSLDYAAVVAARDTPESKQPLATHWSSAVAAEFIRRYLSAMEGSPALPDDPGAIDALLTAYAVARALRELHWELSVRPDWVGVPLAGLRRMLGQQPSIIS
ncbi:MAG: maltose alpha-D-glucosyltransferase [Actinomycetota bacterium]|nr:maltose alpha-D-glucosyltransferase [Actinomycetota bacterium]